MSRQAQTYASELRDVRNRWAHNEPFTAAEAYRAIDTAELLLRAIGEERQAAQVTRLKAVVAPRTGGKHSAEPTPPDTPLVEEVTPPPPPSSTSSAPPKPPPVTAPRIQIHASPTSAIRWHIAGFR